jgi:phospholipid/cholesterol/gamma-HCH transport system substrate-binding protein
MRLNRRIRIQLVVFAGIAVVSGAVVFIDYLGVPNEFFGLHRYTVRVELPRAAGLYARGNVTYRGVEVGRVQQVRLTDTGTEAVLRLDSNFKIPADLTAQVHSVSAVGEQYVALVPHSENGPSLKNGDVIPEERTYIPPDINSLLGAVNRGLNAIPRDNLQTVVDEAYTAVGGLGPELSRFVNGTTTLAIDAHKNIDSLVTLIDQSKPVLDSQTRSSDSIQAWAAHLAAITSQLHSNDSAVQAVIQKGPAAASETQQLLDRLQPTLPIVLANLVSVGEVAVTYRPNLEALLVELPVGTADLQAILLPNRFTKQDYQGAFLSFRLNLNLPTPCTTGFLPTNQMRAPILGDFPDRPPGNLYCRVPQDSTIDVRGARNYPCETRPGKRAPTVKMCESNEEYVPLNDGFNWKGDPNATITGQGVPQFDPGETPPASAPSGTSPPPPGPAPPPAAAPPPIASVEYDPATGTYVGPDGQKYTQSNLARGAHEAQTWQQMLIPPTGN